MNLLTIISVSDGLIRRGLITETLTFDSITKRFGLSNERQDISALSSVLFEFGKLYIEAGKSARTQRYLHKEFFALLDDVSKENSNILETINKVKDAVITYVYCTESGPTCPIELTQYVCNYTQGKIKELQLRFPLNWGFYEDLCPEFPSRKTFVIYYRPIELHYHVKFVNFDKSVVSAFYDKLPTSNQINDLLVGIKMRRFLEKYQKQSNAIPFEIGKTNDTDHLSEVKLRVIQLGQGFAIFFKSHVSIGKDVIRGVTFTRKNFQDEIVHIYEILHDSAYVFTPKLLMTNSANLSGKVPEAIPGIEMETLLDLFQKINFIDPAEPGYLDPSTLTIEGQKATVHDLAKSLIFFVSRLNLNRHINHHHAVPSDPEEQIVFKHNLHAYLSHIISALLNEPNAFIRNDLIYQIAESGKLCGRRWQNIVNKIYTELVLGKIQSSENVEEFFLECSDRVKSDVIQEMVYENNSNQGAHDKPSFIKIMFAHGVAVPGAEAFSNDDVNDELSLGGSFKSELEVADFFMERFFFEPFYEEIQNSLKTKMEETKGRFLGNLLMATIDQIFIENKDNPPFQAIESEWILEKQKIAERFSKEQIDDKIQYAEATFDMIFINKRHRTINVDHIEATILNKIQELVIELKANTSGPRALEVEDEVAIATKKFTAFMYAFKDELLEGLATKFNSQKAVLSEPIMILKNYFTFDDNGEPTAITKEGVKNLLLHFNLIEKKSHIMQD